LSSGNIQIEAIHLITGLGATREPATYALQKAKENVERHISQTYGNFSFTFVTVNVEKCEVAIAYNPDDYDPKPQYEGVKITIILKTEKSKYLPTIDKFRLVMIEAEEIVRDTLGIIKVSG
jgi:hypothetical protein